MCVCICMCVCVCLCTFECCFSFYKIEVCSFLCLGLCLCIKWRLDVCTYGFACVGVCVCVCVCVCVRVHMCVLFNTVGVLRETGDG